MHQMRLHIQRILINIVHLEAKILEVALKLRNVDILILYLTNMVRALKVMGRHIYLNDL